MPNLIQYLDSTILNINSKIGEKISGINYFEKLKYLLIDDLKKLSIDDIKDFENQEISKEFGDKSLKIRLQEYKDSTSNIKYSTLNDELCIVLEGYKSIKIYNNLESNNSNSLNLYKFMGLVLPKNTVVSESISNDTKLINIFNSEAKTDIEK